MCGRSRVSIQRQQLLQSLGLPEQRWRDPEHFSPSYNVSPGSWIPVIRLDKDGAPEIATMKWGLVPSFTKPGEKLDHWRMFNARNETVHTSPVFRRLLPDRRCIVLLNGFYEWKEDAGGRKQPYYIYVKPQTTQKEANSPKPHLHGSHDQEIMMAIAGLWDICPNGGDEGKPLLSVTLLTCDSCESLAWLHDRMPVILDSQAAAEQWLGAPLPAGCQIQFPCDSQAGSLDPDQKTTEPDTKQERASPQEKPGDSNSDSEQQCVKVEVKHEAKDEASHSADGHKEDDTSPHAATIAALIAKVCHPYRGPGLSWHPVTQEMTKMSYQSPDCCQDVRARKGTISSFFSPKSKQAPSSKQPAKNADDNSGPTKQQELQAENVGHKRQPNVSKQQQHLTSPAKRRKGS